MDTKAMATQDDLPTLVIPPDALPLEQNPAAVYLASLGSGSRRTMHRALDSIAAMLTAGNADALTCNWAALRFQHTAAIRAQLIARYAPANTRKHLSALRGTVDGPLFVPVHQSGRMRIARMTTQAAYNILDKRAREAGIENVTPHDMRRTAIGNLLEVTDLATAQAVAGHDDPKTTARYDRRGERAKKEAAALLKVPYQRRELPTPEE
jgi:hypothetical protein